MRYRLIFLIPLLFTMLAMPAVAKLPASVASLSGAPLKEVGKGQYRKLGFNVYRVSLWAADGKYDKEKPYALRVHYLRSLSKQTVVDAVMDDIRKQKLADENTMNTWQKQLTKSLRAVKKGDEIIGLSTPGKPSTLFFNGKKIASITDERLSESFFNIWLGDIANQDLRAQLIQAK